MSHSKIRAISSSEFQSDSVVLLRVDLNLPLSTTGSYDLYRLKSIIPTVEFLLSHGIKILLCSHFGRPKGQYNPGMSLLPIAKLLEEHADLSVYFHYIKDTEKLSSDILKLNPQKREVILLENLRFYPEEEENNYSFAKELSSFADIYINDAFSCSHRSHASIDAIVDFLPSYIGLLFEKELQQLEVLVKPDNTTLSLVAGSKISSKISLLKSLTKKSDYIYIAGAMAHNFLLYHNHTIGSSLYEENQYDTIQELYEYAAKNQCQLILPTDFIVSDSLTNPQHTQEIIIEDIHQADIIFDIGSKSIDLFQSYLEKVNRIIWNGPVGAFEYPPFDKATTSIATMIGKYTQNHEIISIAGGGDSVAAINHSQVFDQFSYISTAGGAFLEWIENNTLIAIEKIKNQSH